MRVSSHIKISGVLSLGVYAYTGGLIPSAACFLSGWLIDIDHFLDWVMNFGPTRDYTRVVNNFSQDKIRRSYLLFHAWEYVVGLLALHMLYGLPPWAAYGTLGYFSHLTLDQIFNCPSKPFFYFLTYRIFNKFNSFYLLRRGRTYKSL